MNTNQQKICLVLHDLIDSHNYENIETIVSTIKDILPENNYHLKIVFSDSSFSSEFEIATVCKKFRISNDLDVDFVNNQQYRMWYPEILRNSKAIYEYFHSSEIHYDIIIFHGGGYDGYLCLKCRESIPKFNGSRIGFFYDNPRLWQNNPQQIKLNEDYISSDLERSCVSLSDFIMTSEPSQINWMKDKGWILPNTIIVKNHDYQQDSDTIGDSECCHSNLYGLLENQKEDNCKFTSIPLQNWTDIGFDLHKDKSCDVIKISFIITAHVASNNIIDAINSTINQYWNNLEIIVVIPKKYKSELDKLFEERGIQSTKIQIIISNTGFIGQMRNIGVQKSSGDYIVFLDDNSLLCSDFIIKCFDLISNTNAKCIIPSLIRYYLDGREDEFHIPLGIDDHCSNIIKSSLLENIFGSNCFLVKREILLAHQFDETADSSMVDWAFFMDLQLSGIHLDIYPRELLHYSTSLGIMNELLDYSPISNILKKNTKYDGLSLAERIWVEKREKQKNGLILSDKLSVNEEKRKERETKKISRNTCISLENTDNEILIYNIEDEIEIVRNSKFFDANWYLSQYIDIANAGLDPARHFAEYGWREGRDPGPLFPTSLYLQYHPDVSSANINPLIYLCKGLKRKSENFPQKDDLISYCSPLSEGSPCILCVTHEFSRTGAPLIILKICEYFVNVLKIPCIFLSMRDGELRSDFEILGPVFIANNEKHLLVTQLSKYSIQYAIFNSMETQKVRSIIQDLGINNIFLIHEMAVKNSEDFWNEICKGNDEIIVPAEIIKKRLLQISRHKNLNISILPQGLYNQSILSVDRNIARNKVRMELNIPLDSFIVLGCGYLDMRKGVDLFVSTAKMVLSKSNDMPIHFIWLGGINLGPYSSNRFTMNWASWDIEISEIENKVHFVGERHDVSYWFAAADIYYMCSRMDPFPSTVMEAMAAGVPVICFSDATGSVDIIQDDAGIVVPYLDINSAADEILFLSENYSILKQLGSVARNRILSEYNFSSYAEKIWEKCLLHKPSLNNLPRY